MISVIEKQMRAGFGPVAFLLFTLTFDHIRAHLCVCVWTWVA